MASTKKNVRLTSESEHTVRVLTFAPKGATTDKLNWSAGLNAACCEHRLIMEAEKPELTDKQWLALACAYNGYLPSEDPAHEASVLPWHISEAEEYDENFREIIGDEYQALFNAIQGMSVTQRLSAIYHAKAYWSIGMAQS